jgi:hypothetical protein
MRLFVRLSISFAVIAGLIFSAGSRALAQDSSSSSSSSSTSAPTSTPASAAPVNSAYIAIDPLANVRYDNRYDVSLGMAYDHTKAGPNLLEGSNLGGLDLTGSYWLSKHWGAEGSVRGYVGTSGAGTNSANIKGPFVAQYFFAAGPEWLGPHNKHGALIPHVLVGGVYGNFERDLRGNSPSVVAFYNDQVSPTVIMGGHFDLNRSSRWVFRITPDAVLTHYSTNYGNKITQTDINFAISVGMEYKFKKKR